MYTVIYFRSIWMQRTLFCESCTGHICVHIRDKYLSLICIHTQLCVDEYLHLRSSTHVFSPYIYMYIYIYIYMGTYVYLEASSCGAPYSVSNILRMDTHISPVYIFIYIYIYICVDAYIYKRLNTFIFPVHIHKLIYICIYGHICMSGSI